MGKISGFLEWQRIAEVADPVRSRVRHFREFIHALVASKAFQRK